MGVVFGASEKVLHISIIGPLLEALGSASGVQQALAAYSGQACIDIELSSRGGELSEGLAIRASLSEFKRQNPDVEVSVIVGSEAYSAAALILCSEGCKVLAHRGAAFMIHNASGFFVGSRHEIDDFKREMEIADGQIKEVLAVRLGDEYLARLEEFKDIWLDLDEALAAGLVDGLAFEDPIETGQGEQDARTLTNLRPRLRAQARIISEQEPKATNQLAFERQRQRELRKLASKNWAPKTAALIERAFDDDKITLDDIRREIVESLVESTDTLIPAVNEIGTAPVLNRKSRLEQLLASANALH